MVNGPTDKGKELIYLENVVSTVGGIDQAVETSKEKARPPFRAIDQLGESKIIERAMKLM